MSLDKKVTHLTRCDSCDCLILDQQSDQDGYVACPDCGHAHAVTRRAKLAEARAVLAATDPGHYGAADAINGQRKPGQP